MDPRPHTPGDGTAEPLLAESPAPPGSDVEEIVDAIDERIREAGPEDVEEADKAADAVDGHSTSRVGATQEPPD